MNSPAGRPHQVDILHRYKLAKIEADQSRPVAGRWQWREVKTGALAINNSFPLNTYILGVFCVHQGCRKANAGYHFNHHNVLGIIFHVGTSQEYRPRF